MPPTRLRRLIDMIHSHNAYISTGGYIERVLAASGGSTKVVGQYLETCKEMGYEFSRLIEIWDSLSVLCEVSTFLSCLADSYPFRPMIGLLWSNSPSQSDSNRNPRLEFFLEPAETQKVLKVRALGIRAGLSRSVALLLVILIHSKLSRSSLQRAEKFLDAGADRIMVCAFISSLCIPVS